MKRKLLAFILAAVLLCCLGTFAFADNVASQSRNGVAVLGTWVEDNGESYLYSWGTCFFVGKEGNNPKYLVTNHHVISDFLELGAGAPGSYRDERWVTHDVTAHLKVFYGNNVSEEPYVVDYDEVQDIAILRLDKATDKRTPLTLREPSEDMVGDKIFAVGYPGIADAGIDAVSVWGVEDSLITNGTIGRFMTESSTGAKWIQSANVSWTHGNSGGPVMLEDGTVIGMVAAIQADSESNAQMNYAVNIEPVMTLLKKNNIEFEDAANKIEEPVIEEEPAEDEEEEKDSLSTGAIIGICVGVAAVIGAIVFALLKKKKKTIPQPDAMPKQEPVKELTPVVRSMSQQHNGKKVKIKGQPVLVGRDMNCNVVFQSDTPGVSSRHCTIDWDANAKEFLLTDLKSTYGTFLASGQQLTPGVAYRLRSGDSFYLGDKNNLLRVEIE